MEIVFTVFFSVELCINAFSTWFAEFVASGWNWFDTLVIGSAILTQTNTIEASGLVHLRLLRAFRVLRLTQNPEPSTLNPKP